MLPADLRTAEAELLTAVAAALAKGGRNRWTAELRFEGLRILPVALRLTAALQPRFTDIQLVCPDAGATALAKRDAPDLAPAITSLGMCNACSRPTGAATGCCSWPPQPRRITTLWSAFAASTAVPWCC